MKKKTTKTRFVAMMMAAVITLTAVPNGFTVQAMEDTGEGPAEVIMADETEDSADEAVQNADAQNNTEQAEVDTGQEDTEQETVEPETTEQEVTEQEVTEQETTSEPVTEEQSVQEPEEFPATDSTPEKVVPEEGNNDVPDRTPSFTQVVEGVSTSGIDFSSRELLIGTDDPSILTWDTEVLSEYRGVYLTRYESVEATSAAYTYYYDKSDFVSANITFRVADDSKVVEGADLSNLNEGDDALSNLNDLSTSDSVPAGTIAVIDSGCNLSGLVGSVSVLGGSTQDSNGHGDLVVNTIREVYPDAEILSIKAMDALGKGHASDVYSAVMYAVEKGADIINLSISAYSTADNAVIRKAIEDAVANGCIVVSAAGNAGSNARYYLPAGIDAAMVIGACDSDGVRLSSSNYGDTVDGYLEAESTSEAAARFSALVARDGFNVAKASLKAGTGREIQEDGDITWMTPGWFEVAAYPNNNVSPVTLKDSDSTEYTVPDLMYIDYKITGTGSLIGSYWTNPLDGKSYKRGTYLTAEWGDPYAPTYVYHSSTENKDYTLDTKLKKNSDGTYLAKKADGTYDQTTTITYKKSESKAFCVDYGKSTPYSGTGTARLYLDSTSVDSEGRVRYVAFGTTSKGSSYQRVGMYVYLKVTNKPEHHYTSIWKWELTGDDEYPVTSATKSMAGITYTLYSKAKKKIAVFHMDKKGYAYNITDIADGYTEINTKYAGSYDQHYLKAPENETMDGFYYVEGGKSDWYTIDTTPIPASVVSNTTDPTKITSSAHDRFKDGITEGFDTKKKYYAAFLKQGKVSELSLEGIIYGLYDSKNDSDDHLVARFLIDADGYVRAIQTTNACKASTKYIEWDEENEKFKMWNYPLKENGSVKTRSIRLSLLEDEPKGFYFHEIQSNQYYEKSDEWIPAVWVAMDSKPTTIADFGENLSKFTKAKDNPIIEVTLKKAVGDSDCDIKDNPNYSLTGAEYKLFETREAADAARISRNKGAADYSKSIGTFKVKADGSSNVIDVTDYMKDANGNLRKDTKKFYVVESKAPVNFEIDPTEIGEANVSIKNVKGNPATFTVYDTPVADPINVFVKKVFADGTEQFLAGAAFTVKYYAEDTSKNYTYADLQSKKPKLTKTYITEKDEKTGKILAKIKDDFPMGYITIEESKAPTGFTLDGSSATVNGKAVANVKMCFVLLSKKSEETGKTGYEPDAAYLINDKGQRSDSDAFKVTVTNEVIVSDQAVRGDIEVHKVYDTTEDPWEGAFFRIENVDTKEAHYIVTDAEGYASTHSAYQKHSENTGYYDDGKAYDKTKAGVWFVKGLQDTEAIDPNDKVGAMPKGHYTVTETDANGLQLEEPVDVWIGYTLSRNEKGEIIWTDTDSDGVIYQIYDYNRGDGRTEIADIELPKLGTLAVVSDLDSLEIDRTKELEINEAILAQVSKVLPADKDQTVYDICTYSHLKVNTTFTLVGTLMQKKPDGSLVEFATAKTTFTTKAGYERSRYEACGTEIVKFEGLDLTNIQDTEFVVFERLYLGTEIEEGKILTTYPDSNNTVVKFPLIHEEAGDKFQTIHTPTGPTTADNGSGKKCLVVTDKIRIRDRVDYKGMEIGREFVLVGTLYKRPDNIPEGKEFTEAELDAMKVRDVNGNPITAEKRFTPTAEDGTVYVDFEFSASLITGEAESFVVFEDCYDKEKKIKYFCHASISDRNQTVYVPTLGTQAKSKDDRSEILRTDDVFYDVVTMKNLDPNTDYVLRAVAIDKATKEPMVLKGKELRSELAFRTGKSTKENGAVDCEETVTFHITEDMKKDMEGKHMVIYEYLYEKGDDKTVIQKHDVFDCEGQELYVPIIGTSLVDAGTKTHVTYPGETISLQDTVSYKGLIPNRHYSMECVLKLKPEKDGEQVVDFKDINGNTVFAVQPFTASETGEGTVVVTLTFRTRPEDIAGRSVVAFEKCLPEGDDRPVAVEENIENDSQTVDVPTFGTKASDSLNNGLLTVTDVIGFTNLNTNYPYTAKGTLVDHEGKPVVVNGKQITAETTFTPATRNGSVSVTFPAFNPYYKYQGTEEYREYKFVVYEEIYLNTKDESGKDIQILIGQHKDPKDSNQTVTNKVIQTGDETPIAIFAGICVLALVGAGVVIRKKRRMDCEEE